MYWTSARRQLAAILQTAGRPAEAAAVRAELDRLSSLADAGPQPAAAQSARQ